MVCKFHFPSFSSLSPESEPSILKRFMPNSGHNRSQLPNFLICNDANDGKRKIPSQKRKPSRNRLCSSLPIQPNSILSWQSNKCHHKRDAKWLQLCKIIIDLLSLARFSCGGWRNAHLMAAPNGAKARAETRGEATRRVVKEQ